MDTSNKTITRVGVDRPTVTIDIFSDVVCPWCYIGKRRFEAGLADATADDDLGVDFKIVFKPYQLDPHRRTRRRRGL